MKHTILSTALLILVSASLCQNKYRVSFEQLKEFEGFYEYLNKSTLKMAASPRDTVLYAIINESRYPLTAIDKDVFENSTKDKVIFFRDKARKIKSYSVGKDTFNLISDKITFPREMWYPRIGNGPYNYTSPRDLKDGLATGNLENTGLDKKLLAEMVNKIIDGAYPNVHSILNIKDGKLVFEEYFYEYHRDKLHELRSATKSFVSALTGIAIQKKFIKDQSESVLSFFPEYTIKNDLSKKTRITIENMLTNQSGLDCDVANPNSVG